MKRNTGEESGCGYLLMWRCMKYFLCGAWKTAVVLLAGSRLFCWYKYFPDSAWGCKCQTVFLRKWLRESHYVHEHSQNRPTENERKLETRRAVTCESHNFGSVCLISPHFNVFVIPNSADVRSLTVDRTDYIDRVRNKEQREFSQETNYGHTEKLKLLMKEK